MELTLISNEELERELVEVQTHITAEDIESEIYRTLVKEDGSLINLDKWRRVAKVATDRIVNGLSSIVKEDLAYIRYLEDEVVSLQYDVEKLQMDAESVEA